MYLLAARNVLRFSNSKYKADLDDRFGGRQKSLEQKAKVEANSALDTAKSEINAAGEKAKELGAQAQNAVKKVTG